MKELLLRAADLLKGARLAPNFQAELRAAAEQCGEPVAWIYSVGDQHAVETRRYEDSDLADGCVVTPLYLAPPAQPATHLDDVAIGAFAAAMKAKMAKKRADGRGGWEDKAQCSAETLQNLLIDHLSKGDPVDIGNIAMMLWNRGESTVAPAQPEEHAKLSAQLSQCRAEVARFADLLAETPEQSPAQAVGDAERYRYLQRSNLYVGPEYTGDEGREYHDWNSSPEYLNAMIDKRRNNEH